MSRPKHVLLSFKHVLTFSYRCDVGNIHTDDYVNSRMSEDKSCYCVGIHKHLLGLQHHQTAYIVIVLFMN